MPEVHRSLLTAALEVLLVAARSEIAAAVVERRERRSIGFFESFVSLPPVIRRMGYRPAVKDIETGRRVDRDIK